jgi:transposase
MDRIKARRPQPRERKLLHRMKRQLSNAVNSRHARIILLSTGGVCNREIAARVGCTPVWVRRIIHRFNAGGIDAIWWCPYCCVARAGPRRFFAEVVEEIAAVALSPPKRLIGMSVWSLAKLRDYLVEQRIVPSISLEWLRHLLRQCKIRWRHTKTWKESNDPEFWPKYRRLRRLYARRPKNGVRLCVDEFGPLNLQPRHGRHYARIRHVDRLRASYHRTGGVQHFLGLYDLERDTLTGRFVWRKNWRTFLEFLKWVRGQYPLRRWLHMVLDNVGYHRKAEVQMYAASHRIKFYWTPTNASWLNRIECQFTARKKFALDHTDHRTHQEQQQAIRHYLSWRNRRRRITLQPWTAFRRTTRVAA